MPGMIPGRTWGSHRCRGFDPFGDYPGQALARAQGSRTVSTGFYFIIPNRIMERQTRRVNLIDRDVDMHVVRVVVDHAYALMFSVAEFLAKTLLDHP